MERPRRRISTVRSRSNIPWEVSLAPDATIRHPIQISFQRTTPFFVLLSPAELACGRKRTPPVISRTTSSARNRSHVETDRLCVRSGGQLHGACLCTVAEYVYGDR